MTDDPFIEVIGQTVGTLDRLGIVYAITGSIASGVYGEPIVSQDVDFGIRVTEIQAARLADELPHRFYRNRESLIEIARRGGMANLIDAGSGWKVDLSVLPRTPFYDAVLSRRIQIPFGPGSPIFFVVSPEDIILMKLLWRKESRSEKQWANALSVARTGRATLDWEYLFRQASTVGIVADLVSLRNEAAV